MQPYDIVSKLWIQQCTGPFLKELLGTRIKKFEPIEEVAQEQPAINRADYVLKTQTPAGISEIYVLEFLTRWEIAKLIDFARYVLFCRKRLDLRVRPVLVLFKPHSQARSIYRDGCVCFEFRLLKLYQLEADKIFRRQIPELYPLIPSMKGGVELAETVNRALLASQLPRSKKADLLAVLRVFLGLRDKMRAARVRKEQDAHMNVMAESPVYQEILQQGVAKGRAEGKAEGRAEGLRKGIGVGSEIRFGAAAKKLRPALEACSDVVRLERAADALKTVKSLDELRRLLL